MVCTVAIGFACNVLDPTLRPHDRSSLGDQVPRYRFGEFRQIGTGHIARFAAVPGIGPASAGMSTQHHNLLAVTKYLDPVPLSCRRGEDRRRNLPERGFGSKQRGTFRGLTEAHHATGADQLPQQLLKRIRYVGIIDVDIHGRGGAGQNPSIKGLRILLKPAINITFIGNNILPLGDRRFLAFSRDRQVASQ